MTLVVACCMKLCSCPIFLLFFNCENNRHVLSDSPNPLLTTDLTVASNDTRSEVDKIMVTMKYVTNVLPELAMKAFSLLAVNREIRKLTNWKIKIQMKLNFAIVIVVTSFPKILAMYCHSGFLTRKSAPLQCR